MHINHEKIVDIFHHPRNLRGHRKIQCEHQEIFQMKVNDKSKVCTRILVFLFATEELSAERERGNL